MCLSKKTTFYPLNVANFTTGTQGDRPCNFAFCYKDPLQIPISNITLIIDFWKATFSLLNLNSSQNHWKTIMGIWSCHKFQNLSNESEKKMYFFWIKEFSCCAINFKTSQERKCSFHTNSQGARVQARDHPRRVTAEIWKARCENGFLESGR